MDMKSIGPMAFIIGVVLAILGGLLPLFGMQMDKLVVELLLFLGLIVGLLNVTVDEEEKLLLSGLALVFMGQGLLSLFNLVPVGGNVLISIVKYIIAFASPAVAIVALKVLLEIMRD